MRLFHRILIPVLFVFVFLPHIATAAYPFGDELIRYTFENASTTAVTNLGSGGSTYDTTFSGNATLLATTSLSGSYAAMFDDNGDFINTKFGSGTNPTTQPFTIAMWAIASTSCATVDKHVFGVSATPAASRFYMRCGSAGPNKFVIRVQGQTAVISNTTVTYGQRYHLAMVASSSQALFYVNGSLAATSTYTSYTLPGPLYIGNIWENSSTPANQGFGGFLDEVAVWNRALTPTQISEAASYLDIPGVPTSLTAVGYESKAYLTWVAPTSTSTPTDYSIEYKLSTDSTYTLFNDGVSTATSTTVTGLSNGSIYNFRVSSVSANGTSSPSSPATTTPNYKIEWVSPTPSEGSTVSGSSITAYASVTPSSYTGTTTQVIRLETSGGSLVGTVSTTTRYGDYNLTHFVNQVGARNLSLTANSSGAAYVPTTNTIFIPHNVAAGSDSTIDEVDTEGNIVRTITCTGCGDNEGITLISSTASTTAGGYDHEFMISTENNLASSTMFRMRIHSSSGTTANYTDFYNLGIAHDSNLGLEGIAYNAEKDVFYLATEKVSSGSTPGRLYEVKMNGANRNLVATQICTNLNFSSIATDFSDLAYNNNVLYVLTHESDRVIPVNVTSTSTCAFVDSDGDSNTTNDTGDYLNTLQVTQPEGLTFDATGDYLYVIGEADNYSRYRSTTFTSRATFSGLSDGSYILKSQFTDTNNAIGSSTSRSFTLSNDAVAPSVSLTSPASSATIATTTTLTATASDNVAVVGVKFYVGTTLIGSEDTSSPYSLSFDTTSVADGAHTLRAVARDAGGNQATSSVSVTVDNAGPSQSSISANGSLGTSATITWTTNESATSFVEYGLSSTYTASSSYNSTATTSHSFSISGLTESTLYHYRVVSIDAIGNRTNSSDGTFTTSDVTAPQFSNITSTSVSTSSVTITWDTNELATRQVEYGLTTSYSASTTLSTASSTSHSVTITGLTPATTYNYRVIGYDTSNNRANSSNNTFTTQAAFAIQSATSTVTSNTAATITWTTPQAGSSYVAYGLSSTNLAATTSEADTSPRVTSHTVNLSGLLPCTTYHYRVYSRNSDLVTASSVVSSFVTDGGCTASSDTATTTESLILASTGATLTLTGGNGTVTVVVPAGFTPGATSSATFQAKDLDSGTFFAGITKPSGETLVGNKVFNLKAYSDMTTVLSSFNEAITVTLTYTAGDVASIDESTLSIYRYDGSSWHELSGCTVNTSNRTVTCTTTQFSDFAIFGTARGGSSSASATGGATAFSLSSADFKNSKAYKLLQQLAMARGESLEAKTNATTSEKTFRFSKTLQVGSKGDDVKKLQQFLNNQGFVVAKTGVGSKGKENTVFGASTKSAVIKFQEFYKKEILTPAGLSKGTGKFGGASIRKANEILRSAQ